MTRNNVKIVSASLLLIFLTVLCISCKPDQLSAAIRSILEVPAPEFSHEGDTYGADISVAVSCGLDGAVIHYTVDGSEPTAESELYTGPIAVAGDGTEVTLRAVAVKENMQNSPVTTAEYTIRYEAVAAPEFSYAPGTYNEDIEIEITCATGGAEIRYTVDGYQPDMASPVYNPEESVAVSGNGAVVDLKAFAVKEGYTDSPLVQGRYTIDYSAVAMPVFDPPSGTYNVYDALSTVALSCATDGAAVYWQEDDLPYDPETGDVTGTDAAADEPEITTDGIYLFIAYATKPGLEPSSISFGRYKVDTDAPSAPDSISGPVSTMDTTPTWTWSGNDNSDPDDGNGTFRCKFTDSDWGTGAVTVDSASYTPAAPLSEGDYTLDVQERDDAGNWSPAGSAVSAVTIDITPPGSPSPGNGAGTSDSSPLLNWEDLSGSDGFGGYHLQVSRDPGFGAGTLETEIDDLAVSQYDHPRLPGGGTWHWRVRTKNTDGVYGAWNEWSFTVRPNFSEHVIDGGFIGARSVHSVDIDGDGDMDVLGAASDDNDIAWWKNSGSGFSKNVIDGSFTNAKNVFAAYLNGDNYMDILAVSGALNDIVWYPAIDGQGSFQGRNTIIMEFEDATSVYAADIDNDGDMDVLGSAFVDDDITWWENNGSGGFTLHLIDGSFNQASSVYAADVDGDGDLDVLGAGGSCITWWENNNGGGTVWTRYDIDTDFGDTGMSNMASDVFAVDLDNDGDMEVMGTGGSELAWWENDGSQVFTERNLSNSYFLSREIFAADINKNGYKDILVATGGSDSIVLWENNGDGTFTERNIDTNFVSAESVYAADLDNDGDMDILGAAFGPDEITWWENLLF